MQGHLLPTNTIVPPPLEDIRESIENIINSGKSRHSPSSVDGHNVWKSFTGCKVEAANKSNAFERS